jgi:hypothetical protein
VSVTLDMNKQQVVLDMNKKFVLNMEKAMEKQGVATFPILRTRAAIDASGSMQGNFYSGYVSTSVDRFIAAALKFDDNGELEIGFFNTRFLETPVAVLADAGVYMQTKARTISANGGTEFEPIVAWTLEEDTREGAPADQPQASGGFFGGLKKMFGVGAAPAPATPVESTLPDCGQYTGIITDGSLNNDAGKNRFESALKKTDANDSFFQFIGIGDGVDVQYLTSVAKRFSNVGFVYIPDPSHVNDDEFYALLANEKFIGWIKQYNAARGVK